MRSSELKPSISTRIAFRVCSRSSLPPPVPWPRLRPTASISSKKIIHGDSLRACSNRSRTRLAPTPTNISTKSEPLILMNGTSASPAIALANKVLPVPGGPTSSTPRGRRPPSEVNLPGLRKNSVISETSSLASSIPATSSKVTPVRCSLLYKVARDFGKPIMPPCPPRWRINKK